MVFNPDESIEFHGFTGPFIQYTHARIKSILRKSNDVLVKDFPLTDEKLLPLEKQLIILLEQYPIILEQAFIEHNPSIIANYVFDLAKMFNSFLVDHSILYAETPSKKQLRLQLASMTANVIKSSMQLLGINVPERM